MVNNFQLAWFICLLPQKGVYPENLHINILMVSNFQLAWFICLLPEKRKLRSFIKISILWTLCVLGSWGVSGCWTSSSWLTLSLPALFTIFTKFRTTNRIMQHQQTQQYIHIFIWSRTMKMAGIISLQPQPIFKKKKKRKKMITH